MKGWLKIPTGRHQRERKFTFASGEVKRGFKKPKLKKAHSRHTLGKVSVKPRGDK